MPMFTSSLTQQQSGEVQNLCLLVNPTGNTKGAKELFFTVAGDITAGSLWEIYINPTVTSNGTIQTIKDVSGERTSTVLLYKAPVVSDPGKLIRKFLLSSNTQKFSTNGPWAQMDPGDSILIRRITDLSKLITNTWRWIETDI